MEDLNIALLGRSKSQVGQWLQQHHRDPSADASIGVTTILTQAMRRPLTAAMVRTNLGLETVSLGQVLGSKSPILVHATTRQVYLDFWRGYRIPSFNVNQQSTPSLWSKDGECPGGELGRGLYVSPDPEKALVYVDNRVTQNQKIVLVLDVGMLLHAQGVLIPKALEWCKGCARVNGVDCLDALDAHYDFTTQRAPFYGGDVVQMKLTPRFMSYLSANVHMIKVLAAVPMQFPWRPKSANSSNSRASGSRGGATRKARGRR